METLQVPLPLSLLCSALHFSLLSSCPHSPFVFLSPSDSFMSSHNLSYPLPLYLSLLVKQNPHYVVRRLGLGICSSTSHSHSHALTVYCTCCYDEIKRIQDQDLFSCSFSDSLSLSSLLSLPLYLLSSPLCLTALCAVLCCLSLQTVEALA